jgi:hypothetical protein
MRTALVAFAALVGLAGGQVAKLHAISTPPITTVSCKDVIDVTRFPYTGDAGYPFRLVLGAVSAPPAYLPQVVDTRDPSWRYWRKVGMVVRFGRSVDITVPKEWQKRAAIVWGNSQTPSRGLHFPACDASRALGNAWAGGFFLRTPSACLPLIFHVGPRTARLRFGLGRRCA